MEQNNKQNKKIMLTIVGIAILVMGLIGVTYAFFNYTRTGSANVIKTGKISFNSEQGTAINLTNMFPIDVTSGIPNDNTKVGTVTINVTGDTTYNEGIEYLVSAVNVQNTVGSGANEKALPISIDVSVSNNTTNDPATTLGTADSDYFDNRGGNSSIYKVLANETISNNDQLLVGYITKGVTGVDGNIVIKAYLDASKILISDTYNNGETPTDNLGTPASLGEGKTVFTTQEWNSLQQDGVSFQVKVEANQGIWVEEPWNATDVSCFTYNESNSEITITGYDEVTCGTDVVIPKKINNLNVTKIGEEAFTNGYNHYTYQPIGKGLTSVAIPDTVTSIDTDAFANNQLTSINLPSSVTSIGDRAFVNNQLTSINLPSSVTSIGTAAFASNQLTSINLPNSITYIGGSAFTYNQLTSITIPSGYIDSNAFAFNLITDVTILSGVEELNNSDSVWVFEDNPIESIYIDMVNINDGAFEYYLSQTLATLIIGPNVRTIGYGAFSDNSSLSSLTIQSGVTTIGNRAFYGNNLTSVTIPSSVTTIGESAFSDNRSLSSLTIQSGVTTIGESAFSYNNLTSITIPSSVTTIGYGAFSGNSLSSLTIQSGVTTIGESAFSSNNLTSITIPSSVTSIGDSAFEYNNISSVTIKGKNSSNDFDSYGNDIWGWDYGYDDSNIIWEGSN